MVTKGLTAAVVLAALQAATPRAHAQKGGVPLWTNRYNAPMNGKDIAYAIAVGSNGVVYVTGQSVGLSGSNEFATIAYSNGGLPLWTNRYGGHGDSEARAITVDSGGRIFVTGGAPVNDALRDYVTICYSPDGAGLWTNIYGGPGVPGTNVDFANLLAVGAGGNVFVSGQSMSARGDRDYATIAYSSDGLALWTNRYSGPSDGDDWPNGIAVGEGGNGNVYVTGIATDGSSYDCATLCYSAGGIPLWTNRYEGTGGVHLCYGAAIAAASDRVFVTGYEFVGSGYQGVTLAYSAGGVPLWTNWHGARGRAIAVDPSGHVIVGGTGGGLSGRSSDFLTLAYTSGGVPLWTNSYTGPANGSGGVVGVATDYAGNVFVAGYTAGVGIPTPGDDFATVAYSSAGVPLWTNRYNGNYVDDAEAVAVDRAGNVFVTGYSLGVSDYDFLTIKYASSIPRPRLEFQSAGGLLVLNWTNPVFNLQFASTAGGSFTNIVGATSPYTNGTVGVQRYFRLVSP
jgi:Beta-propeller repeat